MYEQFTYPFSSRRDPSLRAGDADREAFGERLRRHHAEGRLDAEEFQERIDRCYEAKTLGDLEQLMTDLPPEQNAQRRGPSYRPRFGPLIPILIAVVLISAVIGPHHHFGLWILIPLFFLARFWRRRWSWMFRGAPRD